MPIVAGPGDPGTTVDLDRVWINVLADPSEVMSFRVSSFTTTKSVGGEARDGASGRVRWISRASVRRTFAGTFVRPDAERRAWLDRWAGQPVIVRDPDGGKLIGIYPEFGADRPVDGADVSITVQQITASEEV